ncbi:MAG: bifunctional hydroxymethylpyrimidine kinase/phosphomethylpyrimidine kinase [Leptotrichiaceae bacterium]|nr:bifunctional hydroxymethylpyrimidine kinase/phosphomethylpyrimidine kinase [Leptotrichiaceae bacterium]
MNKLKTALTIAGTDPSGGAGIMADLKTFQAREVYGMGVITSVIAQNTVGVQKIVNMDCEFIEEQLKSVFSDIMPDVVKTGMIADSDMMGIIKKYMSENIPYVVDPVMIATSGDRLINKNAIEYLKKDILPLATIITPNLLEAEELTGIKVKSEKDILAAGEFILKKLKVKNAVIKGGHLEKDAIDYLFLENGEVKKFSSRRFETVHTHGTGCTFSAVIAAELAKKKSIEEAVRIAKEFISKAIEFSPCLGKGNGPVNHIIYKEEL